MIRRGSPAEASPEQRRVLDDLADRAEAQATAENFPVALRILPRRARENLMHTYRYARFVDDVGDAAVGDRLALLDAVEADVRALWTGGARLAPVTGLAGLVADGLPAQPLLDLIQANRMDQTIRGYATFEDLLDYCQLLGRADRSNRAAHRRARATARNIADSDVVCNALQVLEHCQDVGEDARAGRVYLPGEDLREQGVGGAALRSAVASPALRRVIGRQVRRAWTMLETGDALVARLWGWPRIAVAGYVAGGRATADALRRCRLRGSRGSGPTDEAANRAPRRCRCWSRGDRRGNVAGRHRRCIPHVRADHRRAGAQLRVGYPAAARHQAARVVSRVRDGSAHRRHRRRSAVRRATSWPSWRRRGAPRPTRTDPDDPVQVALADAATVLPIPLDAFDELVDGCEMDVTASQLPRSDGTRRLLPLRRRLDRPALARRVRPAVARRRHAEAKRLADTLGRRACSSPTSCATSAKTSPPAGSTCPRGISSCSASSCGRRTTARSTRRTAALAELIRFEAARAAGLLRPRACSCCRCWTGAARPAAQRWPASTESCSAASPPTPPS